MAPNMSTTQIRPTPRFLLGHPAHFIALGFGTGLSPFAPGTVGTLLAFPLYALLANFYAPMEILFLLPALFAVGLWACQRTGVDLGVADHGGMVWDEIVAFLLVLVFAPDGFFWQLAAFLWFRFFDIAKPSPIRDIEARFKNGFGVMADDILAAFYTIIVLALFKRVLG
jgi:phosphatidylglycerophosphatase A